MCPDEPGDSGHVLRDGVRIAWALYGTRGPMLVLLPCWIIAHARSWKAQIAYFAQDCRILVIEGRGNGGSDRPAAPEAYSHGEYAADALAVMDTLDVGPCTLIGFSRSSIYAALIAEQRPEQIEAVVLIAPLSPTFHADGRAQKAAFVERRADYEGWDKFNAPYIRADYPGFVRFFFEQMFCEPHSTKQIEDAVGWASETNGEVLVASIIGSARSTEDIGQAYAAIACPTLVIHGDCDAIVPVAAGREVAALCNAEYVEMAGSGHGPHLRHPIAANEAIRGFLVRHGILPPPPAAPRRGRRQPRALYLSSAIGLGHARRDIAIARALRSQRPDLAIEWLAQDPVTRVLGDAGERCHPASMRLASESRHIEQEAGEHDLNVFEALRRMDEIIVRNFRVFQDVVESTCYDLVIADEGWEVDHFWHEHPEFKRVPLVWMTDFVGFAAMPEGGAREQALTADYNREMVGHVERHPQVRDRAIFVGNPRDIVDDDLGRDLPLRRAWTEQRFDFCGYVLGDGIAERADRATLRARLGWAPDDEVAVVTVGGSGVGAPLIRRILAAIPLARRPRPALRVIVITGPRLSPALFPPIAGVDFRGFEPDLPMLLAACDLALVQGGLSTCMELAAVGTPFLYFPLQHHFEQNVHVPHRLAAYGAGRRLSYADASPEMIAAAIDAELGRRHPATAVERDGAARAAQLIAELL